MKKIYGLIKILAKKKYNKYVMISFMSTMFLMENGFFGKGYIKEVIPNFKMIDMNFFNSPVEITTYLLNIGEFGRSSYFYLLLIDLVLLIVLCLLQSTLIIKLLSGIGKVDKYQWLILLPFCRSFADLIETISYMSLVIKFPESIKISIYAASLFTTVKWLFMGATLIVLVILLALNISKIISKKRIDILN